MNAMKFVFCAGIVLLSSFLSALEYRSGPEGAVLLRTGTLEAVVRDGMITGLKDLRSGMQWADSGHVDSLELPVGLGVLHDLANFRAGHIPWGEPTLGQHLKPGFPFRNNFRPEKRSRRGVTRKGDAVIVTWKGLSCGKTFLKDAEVTFTFREAPDGTLCIRTSGRNPDGGVFGAELPLVNLDNGSEIIVPGFGGIAYREDGNHGVMPFGGAPFLEAPLLMAQKAGKALALWMEDPTMRPLYTFVGRSGKSMALIFENLNLMPFEGKTHFQSPELKLNVFRGGWKTAATPFRNWYRTHFQKEIAVRESVGWANGIRTIFDVYMVVPESAVLKRIAADFPEGSAMFQIWNARAASFDQDLPDWTPRKGYVEGVKRLHEHGFRAMAYVNTYCANYLSPVWKRDGLSSFFLTRKNSLYAYKGTSRSGAKRALSEKLIGTVDYSDDPLDQFKNIMPGRLLYGDPLSDRWKQYHAEMMKQWNGTTGTDANYEDTAGTGGDCGNGIVNGRSAGEGNIDAMRILQKTQPHVPMASEFGPDRIAFAMKWALNYAGHWGYDRFKKYRIHNQYPVESYLYGYRQWVSGMMGDRELVCHTMAAVSDATGGLGFAVVGGMVGAAPETYRNNYSFRRHLYERAKIFAAHQLEPFFPEGEYPENVRCLYRGKEGIYSYIDDGALQQMLAPDGRALYGRTYGAARVRTALWLNNWPMQRSGELFGLDPEKFYPLFPKPENARAARIRIDSLPDGVYAKKYQESPDGVLLELAALSSGPSGITFSLKHAPELTHFYVNDRECDPGNIRSALPLRLTAVKKAAPKKNGAFIGAMEQSPDDMFRGIPLYRCGNTFRAFAVTVDDPDAALAFFFRNRQEKYPWHGADGTIVRLLLNGTRIGEYDCLRGEKGKRKMDTRLHRWSVPLGVFAGKTVLVTLEVDSKANTNWDNQLISIPRLIRDPEQKFHAEIADGTYRIVRNVGKPDKWHGGPVEETGSAEITRKKIVRNVGRPDKWHGGPVEVLRPDNAEQKGSKHDDKE